MAASEADFDGVEALAKMARESVDFSQKRLSFADQCAAFCALYHGKLPLSVVAMAFDITKATASLIGGCLRDDPAPFVHVVDVRHGEVLDKIENRDPNLHRSVSRRPRYQAVAREFNRLGADEFTKRYYTDAVHNRISEARRSLRRDDLRGHAGSNPAAAKFSFKNYGRIPCLDNYYRIAWLKAGVSEFEGWHYSICDENGAALPMGWDWTAFFDPINNEARAFRTSKEAYEGICEMNGVPIPFKKIGRPSNA